MLQTEWPRLDSLIINRVRIPMKLKTFVYGTCWTCVRHWNKHKLFSVINKYCKYQITQLLHISPSEHDVISMGQAQKCSDRLEFNPWSNGKRSHSSSDWMVNTDVQYGKGLRCVTFTVLFAQLIGILTWDEMRMSCALHSLGGSMRTAIIKPTVSDREGYNSSTSTH